jgi:hypothetical protein
MIQVSYEWLRHVWKEKSVQVYAEADGAMAFLARDSLPPLWEDEEGYIASLEEKPDPEGELRAIWTAVYLNHQAPGVITRTLREHVTPKLLRSWMVAGWIPGLMIHPLPDVRQEAARIFWDCPDDSTLRSLFMVFAGKDLRFRPPWAHAPYEDFQKRREEIVTSLREHCPAERKAFFEEQVTEVFGPSLAEVEAPQPTGEVTFKEKETKPGPMGNTQTYEVHTAPSKADALAFLETKTVTQDFLYIIVETPEGNWGKDKMGVFEE